MNEMNSLRSNPIVSILFIIYKTNFTFGNEEIN